MMARHLGGENDDVSDLVSDESERSADCRDLLAAQPYQLCTRGTQSRLFF